MIKKTLLLSALTLASLNVLANECPVVADELLHKFLFDQGRECEIEVGDELAQVIEGNLQRISYGVEVRCDEQNAFGLNVDVYHYEDGLCINRGRVFKELELNEQL